ncbi:hypothetical protein KQI52_15080 [bacterium]|nr:hypothetical protein [bacterium]
MTRLYVDTQAQFDFETTLDGSAVPVATAHLMRLLHAHEGVRGFQIMSAERVHGSMVRIHTQLLLEQEFGPFFQPDQIGDSFHTLAGESHDLSVQGTPLSLTKLHRARVVM